MQRVLASLLIALVGLMALIPQALCPCAQRGRAEVAQARKAGRAVDAQACCPRCLKRSRSLPSSGRVAAHDAPHDAAPTPREAPPICPCCAVNGDGKYLLQLGDVVRPEAPAGFELPAVLSRAVACEWAYLVRVQARSVDDVPDAVPPAERRAGVVLLI